MKKVIILFTLCFLVANAINAQDSKMKSKSSQVHKMKSKEYCAKAQVDGSIVVQCDGRDMPTDMTLTNGTVIKTNGTVIKNDKTEVMLKNGQCVDSLGNINSMIDRRNKKMDKTPPEVK